MAQNYKFFFDKSGTPCARGPAAEKPLMTFLEVDVQGSDHICRDLMNDLTAVEDGADDSRELIGNAHCITITPDGVRITANLPADNEKSTAADSTTDADAQSESTDVAPPAFEVGLKRFREVLEDWEAFILDDQIDDSLADDKYL